MPLRHAAFAALASSVWGAMLALAAVPVYLSRMGIEAYGVIGFFLTTQAILQVLDVGLAPAVTRELARTLALGEFGLARSLLSTLSRIYWGVGIAIAIVFCVAAPTIASAWLGSSGLPMRELVYSLGLMGTAIAARWPIAVYQNAMFGMGRLAAASAINAAMATTTVAASVICVVYVSPTLPALFATQSLATLVYALLYRSLTWRALGGRAGSTFDLRSIRHIWRFSLGMSGVTVTGIALTQLDKALLSRLLSLATFGEYMLAVTIVGGLGFIVAPLFNVIYPRFSVLVAGKQDDALKALYERASRIFAIAFLPIVIALGLYAFDIVRLWTGNAALADRVSPLVAVLCIGSAINGLMYFPYSLQLACGLSWIPLTINTVLLIVLAPLIVILTSQYGARGGAAAWATLEVLYLGLGTYVTQRFIPAVNSARWILGSVIMPFAACGLIAAALHPLLTLAPSGSPLKVALVSASVVLTQLTCVLGFPGLRSIFLDRIGARRIATHPA